MTDGTSPAPPRLAEFSLEIDDDRLATVAFDSVGRTVNLLSPSAVGDIAALARWLPDAAVGGVIIRSGKPGMFCAGADFNDLYRSCHLIGAAPAHMRFQVAYDRFFATSKALRALERAGKPIVAVIDGPALGGGLELALAAHHRIVVDAPRVMLGLPEVTLGLIPGAGGTQRLPRLIGLSAALPMLLEGGAIDARSAVDLGLADILAAPGAALDSARRLLLAKPADRQPWDSPGWMDSDAARTAAILAPACEALSTLSDRTGPARKAVLDALQFGLPQPLDGAIRSEMTVLSHLIQRPETENVMRLTFMGQRDYAKLIRGGALPACFGDAVEIAKRVWAGHDAGDDGGKSLLRDMSASIRWHCRNLAQTEHRALDHIIHKVTGYPAHWGGVSQYR